MNKNKLFLIIASASIFTIFISLIAMMSLVPAVKEKASDRYKNEVQSLEYSFPITSLAPI